MNSSAEKDVVLQIDVEQVLASKNPSLAKTIPSF